MNGRGWRWRLAGALVLVLLAISSLSGCGTPRCTTVGCGFENTF